MSQLQKSGLVDNRKLARQNTFHGNNNRLARGLRLFVCGKRILGWEINNHQQGRSDTFEILIETFKDGLVSTASFLVLSV